jgi:hypothetical protein
VGLPKTSSSNNKVLTANYRDPTPSKNEKERLHSKGIAYLPKKGASTVGFFVINVSPFSAESIQSRASASRTLYSHRKIRKRRGLFDILLPFGRSVCVLEYTVVKQAEALSFKLGHDGKDLKSSVRQHLQLEAPFICHLSVYILAIHVECRHTNA